MILLTNRRASYDYELLEKLQAGIVLTGAEVKSLRLQHGSLVGSFVQIVAGRPVLLNAQISPYKYADNRQYDPKKTRPLLLKKSEIYRLQEKVAQKGLTLVPLNFQLVGNKIKLELAVARGKQQFEKRAKIRARDLAREAARDL